MNRDWILLTFILALVVFFTNVNAATFLDVYTTGMVQPSKNITITGQLTNNTVSVISGINISASVTSGGSGYNITASDGRFEFNITAPSTIGEYSVTITTNETIPKTKTIPVYITNMTGGSIIYVDKSPPFSVGTTFTINVTLLNGTNAVTSYTPNVSIYALNGPPVSWTITNGTISSGADGVINYTITIPSTATSGQYVIVVEKGKITSVFSIKSGYIILVNSETVNEEMSSNFAPSSSIMILAKIKTSAGVAAPSVASSVVAYITLPNGTVESITLTARNQTTYPGYYNNTFTDTSATGTYQVRIDANIGGSIIQSYTFFETRTFNVNLESQKDFFMEWGGTASFVANGTVGLNIVAVNLSTSEVLTVPTGIPVCNSTYLKFDDIFFVNGTSINSSITDGTFTTDQYMMNQICVVRFTGPSTSGIYGIRVNVTIGGVTETARGYFSMQKYFLKSAVILNLGGESEFEKMVSPGENITISLSAYNITSSADVGGSSILNVTITKIVPLEFGRNEITSGINYTVSYGTEPKITLTVPTSIMGPTSVEIQAKITGETVIGNAFFVSNYLMGAMFPTGSGGGGGGGGQGGGFSPFTSCSGQKTFTGTISETKTAQAVAAGSVLISQIAKASEEMTGKDISSCVILTNTGTSGTSGSISINITFSPSCSLSGFYFMVLNATYQGKSAGVPAQFACKNLNFWPNIYSIGGTDSTWKIAPTSGVKITISNITRLNDSKNIGNATVSIPFIFNFNPGIGQRMLLPNPAFLTFLNFTGNATQNNITFDIYPQNFTIGGTTLTTWPNGFIDLQPRVCTEDLSSSVYPWSDGCDTGMGGFQVVAFDAWIQNFQWGSTMQVNSTQSFTINVKTNVSRNVSDSIGTLYTGNNNTAFIVKIGKPWEGSLTNAQNVSATLIADGWNKTIDWGFEQWRLNFTIPATMKKGETMISITINNTNGEASDTQVSTSLSKYSLVIPYEEGIENWGWFYDGLGLQGQNNWNITLASWNMAAVNESLGIWSKSGNICNKTGLIATRYGDGGNSRTIVYNSTVKMLIVDNTSGVYDTIVFNNSGTLSYVNANNYTLSQNAFGYAGLYLRYIEGCSYAKIVNATAITAADITTYGNLPTWAGQAEVNHVLKIPYIVKLGDAPVIGAEVHVNGIAKQGFDRSGFEEKLTEGANYTYTKDTTNSLGFAFLKVNTTNSGMFNLFWKVNTSATDYDIATFATGTGMEIRNFDTSAGPTYNLPLGSVVLGYSTTPISGGWTIPVADGTGVYYGNITERDGYPNDFIRDSNVSTWYFVYKASNNYTWMDDDMNFNEPGQDNGYNVIQGYWNDTHSIQDTWGAQSGQNIGVSSYLNTSSGSNNQMTFTFLQENPRPSTPITLSSVNSNITVMACSKTFDAPTKLPIEGATVKLFSTDFQMMGPPQKKWLTLYNLNGSLAAEGGNNGNTEPSTSDIKTGPAGCVAFKAIYPGNVWTSCRCTEVQAKITSGSNTENSWIGQVCTPCG